MIRFAPGAPQMSSVNVLADDGATEPWGTAGAAADLSGSFAFQWDEDWLYLAAQVTDNVHDVSGGERIDFGTTNGGRGRCLIP